MRANEIVKEEKDRDKVVGGIERGKSLFGFVPCLELFVKAFDQVVGDVVAEALDADMFNSQHGFNGDFVSAVAVGNDGSGLAEMLDGIQQGKSLRAVPVPGKMETKGKAGFTVHN